MKTLLGPCPQYQLEPFAYPEIWDITDNMVANTWTPEEKGVGPDTATYRRLQASQDRTDQSKLHLFNTLWGQLTAMDQQRSEDATIYFLLFFMPEEVKHFLIRLMWEERLHTHAYRYVVRSFGLPETGPDSIYDLWKTVPALKARVEYAEKISRTVEDWWTYVKHNALAPEEYPLALKEDLYVALVFWFMIFEKVWFLINLSGPLQHMARTQPAGGQAEFEGAAKQLYYIARDEYQHILGGSHIIKHYMKENPEVINERTAKRIQVMYDECLVLELDFINECLKVSPILGYHPADHLETAQYFANLGAKSIGIKPPFGDGLKHKFPWMSEMMDLRRETNFFEDVVSEYQKGKDLWTDESVTPPPPIDAWADPLGEK